MTPKEKKYANHALKLATKLRRFDIAREAQVFRTVKKTLSAEKVTTEHLVSLIEKEVRMLIVPVKEEMISEDEQEFDNGSEETEFTVSPNGARTWPCLKCDEVCTTRFNLATHLKKTHKSPNEGVIFKCAECPKVCTSRFGIRNHIISQHSTMERTVKKRVRRCQYCQKELGSWNSYLKHIAEHEGREARSYPCEECDMVYKSSWSLKEHYDRRHSSETPKKESHPCTQCTLIYTSKLGLEKHLTRYHGTSQDEAIPDEQKAYKPRLRSYDDYMTIDHSDVKPYHCSKCPTKSKRIECLRSHIRQHHVTEIPKARLPIPTSVRDKVKTLVCEMCDKVFKSSNGLRTHKKQFCPNNPNKAPKRRIQHS